MAATKQVRWQCPSGEHPAVLGSRRPPADAVVRYCLACSQKRGRLVARVAPALERERRRRADARKARTQSALARDAERERARFTVDGRDLRSEHARMCRLEAWKAERPSPSMARQPPRLTVRQRTQMPRSRLGFCRTGGMEICVAVYPGLTWADACETLLHELAHACAQRARPGEPWHGTYWRSLFRAALREAYGVDAEVSGRVHSGLLADAVS